ncbi:zinc finger protein 62-like isoform X2 [Eurosta solidaginis]|uniref:zinc finger protein 62-like isoform X2 n=1 Tax=Eurosta solidaginis TaxID=178769 RepID=UPI003530C81C
MICGGLPYAAVCREQKCRNKMMCRLCLFESDEVLKLYADSGEMIENDISKVVAKHLQIEICFDDEISNVICLKCWGYLSVFHKFWLSIEDKQRTLNSQLEYMENKEDVVTEDIIVAEEPDLNLENVVIELCSAAELDCYVEEDTVASETHLIAREVDDSITDQDSLITEYLFEEIDITSKESETQKGTNAVEQNHQTKQLTQKVTNETYAENKTTKRGRPRKHHNKNEEDKHSSKHSETFKCTLCSKTWVYLESYVKHMKSAHSANQNLPYKCKHCSKSFSKQSILDSHKKIRHTSINPTCKLCNKTLANNTILRQHIKSVHHNIFESVCEICGKLLKNPTNLQYHMDYIHNTEPHPQVQCTICKKWLKSKFTLRKHMKHHRDEASGGIFKCTQCNVEKSTKKALKSHIRYHHSNVPVFPCTWCGKEFKSPTSLKEHEATHTGAYLYTCSFCPKSFRAHSSMHQHKMRYHKKEFLAKNAQPNEYTKSILNQACKVDVSKLCLIESDEIIKIYTDAGEMVEQNIFKVVAKHFQIEIGYDDKVSNTVCSKCWSYLQEFHRFWLSIDEKQRSLNSHLECLHIKRDIDEVEEQEPSLSLEKAAQELSAMPELFAKAADICETEFVATKTEEEDESTFDQDSMMMMMMEPLNEEIDILSKDAETENIIPVVKQRRKNAKRNQIATTETDVGKKIVKRGRPRITTNITKKENKHINNVTKEQKKDISGPRTARKPQNQEQKRKSILAADKFLAENTELNCCICKVELKDFKELKTHFRQQHQCTGYVFCCDLRFTKRTLYVDHIQLHKNPDFFKCSICNKQLISRKNYMNHMDSQHPAEENLQYECQHCSKKFSKQYILDSHIRLRHAPKDQVCKLCSKAFANVWILRQHEKAVHRNEFDSVCEICGKLLRNPANLQYHMDNIHNTEPRPEVQCTICQKWLKSERTLNKHMMQHRDEESGAVFKCPQCNVEKSTRHSLSSHIRYHHSNRVFPCTMCGKEFKTPIAMKEHEATHTGVDLYTCPFCPKTFRSHANMHKHKIHSHSDEFVRKYAQPNEYTQSILNQAQNAEVS